MTYKIDPDMPAPPDLAGGQPLGPRGTVRTPAKVARARGFTYQLVP